MYKIKKIEQRITKTTLKIIQSIIITIFILGLLFNSVLQTSTISGENPSTSTNALMKNKIRTSAQQTMTTLSSEKHMVTNDYASQTSKITSMPALHPNNEHFQANENRVTSSFSPIVTTQSKISTSLSINSAPLSNYTMSVNTTTFNWYDAMTYGTNSGPSGDDVSTAATLPFSFPFYNQSFNMIYLSSNGWFSFSNSNPTAYINLYFPSNDPAYWNVIAPLWFDLVTNNNVYIWNTFSYIVIEYYNVTYYPHSPAGTFEAVLFSDGSILFQYLAMNMDTSANGSTVGLNFGMNASYYTAYTAGLSNVHNTTIEFMQPTSAPIIVNGPSDTTTPVLDHPANISYIDGSTGHSIIWTATDNNPNIYTIYRNESLDVAGDWYSGQSIVLNVDGLTVGMYNYTIVVKDVSGHSASDTVFVVVTPASPAKHSPSTTGFELIIFIPVVSMLAILKVRHKKR